jgi:hypothetical protein
MALLCAFAEQNRSHALRFDDGSYLPIPDGYRIYYDTTLTRLKPCYHVLPPPGTAAEQRREGTLPEDCGRGDVENLFAYLRGESMR